MTSSYNSCANGFTESVVKVVRDLLTCAKFSWQDAKQFLFPYHCLSFDSYLPLLPLHLWLYLAPCIVCARCLSSMLTMWSTCLTQKVHIRRPHSMLDSLSLCGLKPKDYGSLQLPNDIVSTSLTLSPSMAVLHIHNYLKENFYILNLVGCQ